MGDFDKNKKTDTAAEKKKMMLVGVLGAVLVGVLGFHFLKGGPQVASAATNFLPETDATAGAHIDETPAQAEAALADDPTAKLLRGTVSADVTLGKTPHNPFVLSDEWRGELVRPTEVRPQVHTNQPTYVAPTPQSVNLTGFKLSGILRQEKKLCAIVNGRLLYVGMVLDDAKVVDIQPDHITFQRADSPDGPKSDLMIEPKLQ